MSTPVWTTYVQEMALRYVLNLSPNPAPTEFYFALYTGTADPAGSYHEVSDPSYARAQIFWDDSGDVMFSMAATGSPSFSFTNAGSFIGIRIMDSAFGGDTLWWQDLDTNYEYDAGASVPLLETAIMIGLSNPS